MKVRESFLAEFLGAESRCAERLRAVVWEVRCEAGMGGGDAGSKGLEVSGATGPSSAWEGRVLWPVWRPAWAQLCGASDRDTVYGAFTTCQHSSQHESIINASLNNI